MKTRTIDDFKEVGTDEGVRILSRNLVRAGDYYVMHEQWNWDGISASSLIFCNEDVCNLSDEEIKEICKNSDFYKYGGFTIKRAEKSKYTFFNFNFVT